MTEHKSVVSLVDVAAPSAVDMPSAVVPAPFDIAVVVMTASIVAASLAADFVRSSCTDLAAFAVAQSTAVALYCIVAACP